MVSFELYRAPCETESLTSGVISQIYLKKKKKNKNKLKLEQCFQRKTYIPYQFEQTYR